MLIINGANHIRVHKTAQRNVQIKRHSEGGAQGKSEEKQSARAHKCDFHHVISFIHNDTHRIGSKLTHT